MYMLCLQTEPSIASTMPAIGSRSFFRCSPRAGCQRPAGRVCRICGPGSREVLRADRGKQRGPVTPENCRPASCSREDRDGLAASLVVFSGSVCRCVPVGSHGSCCLMLTHIDVRCSEGSVRLLERLQDDDRGRIGDWGSLELSRSVWTVRTASY